MIKVIKEFMEAIWCSIEFYKRMLAKKIAQKALARSIAQKTKEER